MIILLPRLSGPAADRTLDEFLGYGPDRWPGLNPRDLPSAARFSATGGTPVSPSQLSAFRNEILDVARRNGFDGPNKDNHARFDAEAAAWLVDCPILDSGEALRDDVWAFFAISVVPDVVHWRYGTAKARYFGGVRNTLQRLWMRGKALDRGKESPFRWGLLDALTEDALVQITERPSIGSTPYLARSLAEAWVLASAHYGRGRMEEIMRRATLLLRAWNEVRNLAQLPREELDRVLAEAFAVPQQVISGE